jgi:hypothetical protein
MKDSTIDLVVVSLKMAELLVNLVFLEENIKWIGTLRDFACFEDLKECIGTLYEDEYDDIASSASSFESYFCKKNQLFCLELQLKYLQFFIKLEDVQQQHTYPDQQALRYDNEYYYNHLCDQDK